MSEDAAAKIDAHIAGAPGWRGELVTRVRELVAATAPELSEQWKWNTGMWARGKTVVCGYGIFKAHVKVNFMHGADLPDPDGLFNAGLDAKGSRGIDLREGDALDAEALARLVRAATDAV